MQEPAVAVTGAVTPKLRFTAEYGIVGVLWRLPSAGSPISRIVGG
jgi:hypothetical protein